MTVSMVDRIPPSNLEAEMALLGSILVDRDMMEIVRDIVQPGDLYAQLHETIYLSLMNLSDRGKPLDKIALAEELRSRGMLDRIGGLAYISSLMETVPTAASASYYAKVVREKAALRGLIHAGSVITQLGYEGEDDVEKAMGDAERAMSQVVLHAAPLDPVESSATALSRLANAVRTNKHERPVFTPWPTINRLCGGFLGGELIVIPAAPAGGKSGLVQCISEYVSKFRGPVLHCAPEMGEDATHRRRIAQRSNVSARVQRLGNLDEDQKRRVFAAVEAISDHKLYVTGEKHTSIASFWRAAREIVKLEGSLALIVIDQMGWLDDINRDVKGRTRNDLKSQAFLDLIKLGKAFGCPVIAVDHLNRDGMKERPSIKTMRNIRDGGNAEGHAHHIIFPYRDDPDHDPTRAEAIVAKSREGGTATVPMHFDGARALWCETLNGEPVPPWFEATADAAEPAAFDFNAAFNAIADDSDLNEFPV